MKKLNWEELLFQFMFCLVGIYIIYRILAPIINPASIATSSSGVIADAHGFYSQIINQSNSCIGLVSQNEDEGKADIKSVVFTYLTGIDFKNPLTYITSQMNIMSFIDISSIDPGEQKPSAVIAADDGSTEKQENKDLEDKTSQDKPKQDNLKTVKPKDLKVEKTTLNSKKPLVLIFHTHTTESFKPDNKGKNYSTKNLNITVDEVGEKLEYELETNFGISTIHDSTIHDYPKRAGAYTKARPTIQRYLKKYPSIKLVIDLHRDGGVSRSSCTAIIDKQNYARTLLVAGTKFAKYKEYNKTSQKMKAIFDKYYPGLCRGITHKNSSYNQDLFNSMIILEMGSNESKLQEAINTTKIAAKVIAKYLGK